MASSLPSSFGKPQPQYAPVQPQEQPKPATAHVGESSLMYIAVIVALVLALASFYGTFFMDRPLSAGQKAQIAAIAGDLKTLQDRNMVLSAPVSTTIYLNKSYPIKDLFPPQFDIPLQFEIPINTTLVGISSNGQPVQFQIQESVPINVTIPISSAEAFGTSEIQIQKELPVETQFTSSISVKAAYGQDLNKIIDQLNAIAGQGSG